MNSFDLNQFIKQALQEDVQTGDITSLACIPSENRSKAILKIKEDGILAGVELAKSIFNYLDDTVQMNVFKPDGSYVHLGEVAFEVETGTRNLLMAERLVLNSMQDVYKRQDASIQLENKLLHLNAKRIQKSEDAKSLHKEFADVSYKRSIQLPEDIDTESLKARFENGVLYVQMNRIKKVTHSISVN